MSEAALDALKVHEHHFSLRDFKFKSGACMRTVRVHCLTLGEPRNPAVLVLHGTNGSAKALMTSEFAGELFAPGQVLDAQKYFIVIPDALGAGQTSKPSDELRRDFPSYDYEDMLAMQYRMVSECFGLSKLFMVLGYSMGGMHAWLWAQRHPGMMQYVVPMAAQPAPMSGRNWMLRRILIDALRENPQSFVWASAFFWNSDQWWDFGSGAQGERPCSCRPKGERALDRGRWRCGRSSLPMGGFC
jgi:homoserine O-acetyltransferase/O-succinyltransferase